jgi:cation:H+ antiporter
MQLWTIQDRQGPLRLWQGKILMAALMPWLLSLLGLVILLLAGDSLVKGAVNLSLRLGVPALIVSLTIVAFGTSAPELLISIQAVLDDAPGLAMGNVVGSNTANILLVLGIPALLATMHTSECDTKKSYNYMIAASLLFIALAFRGVFDWIAACVLLAALAYVLFDQAMEAKRHRAACDAGNAEEEEIEGVDPDLPGWRIAMFLILGLIGLPLGASLLVNNATIIAESYGITERIIGLTLVAVGTSLPELATTVMAALRRQADVALGNVIGSNMFNLLAIIGIASFVGPIPVEPAFLRFDLWVMLGASILLVPFVYMGRDITRIWGVILTGLYVLYLAIVLS